MENPQPGYRNVRHPPTVAELQVYRQQLDDESSGDDEWVDEHGKKQKRQKIPLHHTVKQRTKAFAPKGIRSRNLKDINALAMKKLNVNPQNGRNVTVADGPSPFPVSSAFTSGKDVLSPTFNPQSDPNNDKIVGERTDSTVASAGASASASQATTPALVPQIPQIVGNKPVSDDVFLAAIQHQRGPAATNAAAKWKPKKKLTPEEEEAERKKISEAAKTAAKTAKEIAQRFKKDLEQSRNNAAASGNAEFTSAAPADRNAVHLDGFSSANPEGRSLTPQFGVQAPPPPPAPPPKDEPNAAPSMPWKGATPEYIFSDVRNLHNGVPVERLQYTPSCFLTFVNLLLYFCLLVLHY